MSLPGMDRWSIDDRNDFLCEKFTLFIRVVALKLRCGYFQFCGRRQTKKRVKDFNLWTFTTTSMVVGTIFNSGNSLPLLWLLLLCF